MDHDREECMTVKYAARRSGLCLFVLFFCLTVLGGTASNGQTKTDSSEATGKTQNDSTGTNGQSRNDLTESESRSREARAYNRGYEAGRMDYRSGQPSDYYAALLKTSHRENTNAGTGKYAFRMGYRDGYAGRRRRKYYAFEKRHQEEEETPER
jgi:hypothetical protein